MDRAGSGAGALPCPPFPCPLGVIRLRVGRGCMHVVQTRGQEEETKRRAAAMMLSRTDWDVTPLPVARQSVEGRLAPWGCAAGAPYRGTASPPPPVSMCIHVQQSASVCCSVHESALVCISLHQCACVCLRVHLCTSIVHHCASLCITVYQSISVCICLHHCASLCITVHESASVCIRVHHCALVSFSVH